MTDLTPLLVFGISLLAGLVVLFTIFGIMRVLTPRNTEKDFEDMIASITESELELDRADANLPDEKTWSGYWYGLSQKAGVDFESPATPGLLAMGLPLVFFLAGFFIFPRDFVGGAGAALIAGFSLRAWFLMKARARLHLMERQLPNLLAGLRSSLTAGRTEQQALVAQAKELPAPLGTELKKVSEELNVGITLDNALQNLATRVPSREIRFLVSSIRIALSTGAELRELVSTIESITVQRGKLANHLGTAIAKVQPTLWVVGLIIPLAYLFSFYQAETNREFWMSFPIGIIITAVVAFLYGVGMFMTKKMIDRVRNA